MYKGRLVVYSDAILNSLKAFMMDLDTPVSLGVWLRARYGISVADCSIKASDYLTVSAFEVDYQAVSWLRKYPGLPHDPVELERRSLQKFIASEGSCMKTNLRLTSFDPEKPDREMLIQHISAKIRNLIGSEPPSNILDGSSWGPGATFSLTGNPTPADKILEERITVTQRAAFHLSQEMGSDPHFLAARGIQADGPCSLLKVNFEIVPGNRYLTVAKDARSKRPICVEPSGNIYLQKSVGKYIRRRLLRVGIDLDDQSVNQKLASQAYARGLATIDLSSASDSISIELIRALLPLSWFNLLSDLRSPYTRIGDKWLLNHKFSSMGNGFTFELESLIFWAICSHFDPASKVYGDDIICSQQKSGMIISTLSYFGFSVNLEKSFVNGEFFESCGKHFFRGFDVTPAFQKEIIDYGKPKSTRRAAKQAHNRIWRWWHSGVFHSRGHRSDHPDSLRVVRTLRQIGSAVCFQPLIEPDYAFITGDWNLISIKRRSQIGIFIRGERFLPKKIPSNQLAALAYQMRLPGGESSDGFAPRESGFWVDTLVRIPWSDILP